MVSSFMLLILYPIVFLSSRECAFPIQTRQWCRIHIGVLPSGLSPGGFPWFKADFFGLQHHRDRVLEFIFSKLRMDFQTQIWDPGDSNYRNGNGELQLWISHLSGSRFVFESKIGFVVLFRSKTSIPLYIDAGIFFHLLIISYRNSDINFRFGDAVALFHSDHHVASVHDIFVQPTTRPLAMFSSLGYAYIDRVIIDWWMDSWLFQFGFCWIELSILHMGLVNLCQQGCVGIAQIWELEKALALMKWVLMDRRGSDIWDDMVNFFFVLLKRITQSRYFKETLVRKCWCHYVYLSELALDTSAFMLRFVKRSHSHKLLYTIRNKEKSNMKLDNNRSFDRLASKATLRKASSNSLLLYFLLVYGTYICVCNNCVSIILYVFVITLLD